MVVCMFLLSEAERPGEALSQGQPVVRRGHCEGDQHGGHSLLRAV